MAPEPKPKPSPVKVREPRDRLRSQGSTRAEVARQLIFDQVKLIWEKRSDLRPKNAG